MNGIAKFACEASGNPPPSVFWTKEGSQELMFTGTTHGQMHVTSEGTLTIQVAQNITIMMMKKEKRKMIDVVVSLDLSLTRSYVLMIMYSNSI